MADVVLDSSAVLALLHKEPGAALVDEAQFGSRISSVNYAEVIIKLIVDGLTLREAERALDRFGFEVVPADAYAGARAGALEERVRRTGVSLGDKFCLALAEELGWPVLTTDRRWTTLDLGVEIRLIR
jgi:PIN domain nuclease of toxin-antitoxin system